ncbi:hypothetical protein L3V59_36640 [Burkholderia aenigmatica]|uniref:hypothetical protein n=1 Tax=Burkholderia aenigmatica TaxID=2015348 RepID=UPI001F18413A|nr:hypothetical protein [Burkholderia aenigmatica]UKD17470.1 hypothetical protein L3V59_36640 [Burkholderia aenigmatica]
MKLPVPMRFDASLLSRIDVRPTRLRAPIGVLVFPVRIGSGTATFVEPRPFHRTPSDQANRDTSKIENADYCRS